MKIAIIGSGNMGKSIGGWAASVGYEVIFSARNLEHAKSAAEAAGHGAIAASAIDAVSAADMVLLAVPYREVDSLLRKLKEHLQDKILIDITNALNANYSGLVLGYSTSGAEEIAKLVPAAKVVKAFNTVFASIFKARNPIIGGHAVSVIFAGDDTDAKAKVADLITKLGFDAIDAGPLSVARNIEPMGMLSILLASKQGLGSNISFSLLR
jgi:NADPH-dependent F420 reductase